MNPLSCFKAYDIRGRLPDELNPGVARDVGQAYAAFLKPKTVVIGRDVRLSSRELAMALAEGLNAGGADVVDLGLCGTEEIYHATFDGRFDGGIMVTASHNPLDFNGFKLVREGSRPISGDTGLLAVKELAESRKFPVALRSGTLTPGDFRQRYIDHLLGYIDRSAIKPLRVVVNAGNGCAGPVVDALGDALPCALIRVHHEPDGTFPNGIPNPLLPENRAATAEAVLEHRADLGVAWDGDFDRCFLFDDQGTFIEGYYIVGLLAEMFLRRQPGARIIHDPRLTWNTIDVVRSQGGVPVMSKTGHAFIKERMRAEDAVYGGEMSAHHYFRDFAYCDSGMIPWLLVLELMSRSGRPLSDLVGERMRRYPASGEINRRLADPAGVLALIRAKYEDQALKVDLTDGLSLEFADWRFNLRASNTEPVIRLNVESRGNPSLMAAKTTEILAILDTFPPG